MGRNINFDSAFAEEFGIPKAIILEHLKYLITCYSAFLRSSNAISDEAKEKDGRTWVKWPVKRVQNDFPFFTIYQIRRSLNGLVSDGWLETAYLDDCMGGAKWYSLVEGD